MQRRCYTYKPADGPDLFYGPPSPNGMGSGLLSRPESVRARPAVHDCLLGQKL
jgi:hypothetical protein